VVSALLYLTNWPFDNTFAVRLKTAYHSIKLIQSIVYSMDVGSRIVEPLPRLRILAHALGVLSYFEFTKAKFG
jgi:hypothetical protein